MIGAALPVIADPLPQRAGAAPRHEGIDQPIAPVVGEVRVRPAEAPEVVRVVVEAEVALRVTPRGLPGHRGIVAQQHRLLNREQRAGAELSPRDGGVLDRDEERMRAERALGGEAQHSRSEGGEDARGLDLWSRVRSRVHCLEVLPHVLHGSRVALPTRLDGRRVADPEPEEEAIRIGLCERAPAVCHGHRVASPDVRDTRRDD